MWDKINRCEILWPARFQNHETRDSTSVIWDLNITSVKRLSDLNWLINNQLDKNRKKIDQSALVWYLWSMRSSSTMGARVGDKDLNFHPVLLVDINISRSENQDKLY